MWAFILFCDTIAFSLTNVHLLQGTYSSHGLELVMVTVEDYKMTGTKITVCEEKYSIYFKQLLDEVFVISRIIKVEVRVISRRLRLITLTETLIFLDITKTESNNCFIIH